MVRSLLVYRIVLRIRNCYIRCEIGNHNLSHWQATTPEYLKPAFVYTVPLKCNIASACEQAVARVRIIANKRGMAHVSLASIQPTYKRGMARVSLVCHAPFISDYFRASTCNVALERYRRL